MKTLAVLLLMGSCLSFSLFADEIVEIDKEDIVVIPENPKKQVKSSSDPKVVILNNQQVDQDQKSAQQHDQNARMFNHQPVVHVMGTPITTTYAAELKKSRQNAELQTEQKIVEKLESSRLRDEQERLKKLFGGGSPIQKTVVSSSNQAIALEDTKAVDKSEIYAEVVTPIQEKSQDKVYVGVHGGQGLNLTRALEGINSYGSVGFSLGATDDSGLRMESSFFYTNHQLSYTEGDLYSNYSDESVLEDMEQFSAFLSVKYTPFSNRFQPYVGAALSYSHRIYSGNMTYSCWDFGDKYCDEGAKTNSVDLVANVGVDFRLNKKISVGFNMLVNVKNLYNTRLKNEHSYDYDYDYDNYDNDYAIPVKPEETNWIIASINAKLYF